MAVLVSVVVSCAVASTLMICVCGACSPKRNYSAEPTQLFGLPLLVAVPRKQCDYNTLYNCTLAQMALVFASLIIITNCVFERRLIVLTR